MKTRKIILLAACAILLCISIIQTVAKNGEKVKTFDINQTPDEIVFETPDVTYSIYAEGENWLVTDKKYNGNKGTIDSLVEAASSLKALDKVGKLSNETLANRYELNSEKASVVTLKKEGKVLRTVTIGKASSTGSQTYACFDDSKDVYLVAGNLRNDILKSISDLRSKQVFDYNKDDVSSVSVRTYPQPGEENTEETYFSISRVGSGENAMWTSSEPNLQINGETAATWFGSVSGLTTTKWYEDYEVPANGVHAMTVKMSVGNKNITIEVYNTYTEDGKAGTSYATTSLNPYTFLITGSNINKYKKNVEYFAQ